jgi:hypothetical protein
MLISHYVENVQTDLQTLSRLGGDELTSAGSRLADAIEPALRGRLFEALNQLVAEANSAIGNARLELRLSGDEVTLVREQVANEPLETPGELKARFALRLSEELKAKVDEQAARRRMRGSSERWPKS